MKKYLPVLLVLCLTCFSAGCAGKDAPAPVQNSGAPDEDLTVLNSIMAYARLAEILENPDDYFGKIIKLRGTYNVSYFEQTDLYYNLVSVGDETSCCQQWLEFVWNGEHSYPDDYPEENTSIEIAGVFGSYEELDQLYYYLAVDDIIILR